MNFRESVGIALGALRANKMRSFLTLLGTIIGVTSVIAVISFVEGLNRFVSDKLLNAGANVFVVDREGLVMSEEAWEEAQRRPIVTLEDAEALRLGVGHASLVVAQLDGRMPIHYGNKAMKGVTVHGRSAGSERIDDITIEHGRLLVDLDDQRRQLVCVIGPEVAEELFPGADPIGKRIRIRDYRFEVVGVTKAKGKVFGQSQDRFASIPVRTFEKLMAERSSVSISVKSLDQSSMPLAQQEARNIMRARRHLGPGRPDNFAITTSEAYMDLYRNLTGGIFVVSIGVAAISLFVGGIVIMNIMLVSVTERTREIGIRKALGARSRDILTQFLVEATTLSLTGGLIGIALGIGLALLVGALSPLPAAVNLPSILLGILMSSFVGIFFGSYPAAQAAKLDPIESLRYE